MAKIVVLKITKEDKTQKGTKKWECVGTIDGEADAFTVWDQPTIGKEFEGEVRESDKYGKSISSGSDNRGGRGGRRYERDPETGNQIMRQNALDHATQFTLKYAEFKFQAAENKQDGLASVKEVMKPGNIIKVADIFFAYSAGKLTSGAAVPAPAAAPAKTPQETAAAAAFPEAADQLDDPTPPKGQDVPAGDIPF